MKVQKGLATWAGLVAAVGQYLAAVAVFMEADDQTVALGPLLTATATLLAVIVGRMQQAKALAANPTKGAVAAIDALTAATTTNSAAQRNVTMSMTGDTANLTRAISDVATGHLGARAAQPGKVLGEPTDLSLEIPGGGFPRDGERE